jgi:hypothetical protein
LIGKKINRSWGRKKECQFTDKQQAQATIPAVNRRVHRFTASTAAMRRHVGCNKPERMILIVLFAPNSKDWKKNKACHARKFQTCRHQGGEIQDGIDMKHYESSTLFYYVMKYVFLFVAIFIPFILILLYYFPNYVDGSKQISENMVLKFIAISIGSLVLHILWKNKPAIIEINDKNIYVKRGKEEFNEEWQNVNEVFKIPFTSPPIYRMSFTNNRNPVYFAFRTWFYATIVFWSWDFTGFLEYANEKIGNRKAID